MCAARDRIDDDRRAWTIVPPAPSDADEADGALGRTSTPEFPSFEEILPVSEADRQPARSLEHADALHPSLYDPVRVL